MPTASLGICPQGQPGEACTVEGSIASGADTCDRGVMCWDVDKDTLQGTCVAMCKGNADEPICDDPTAACASSNDGVLNLCLPACDPLAPACAADELCVSVGGNFTCVVDASGDEGQAFDPCEFLNDCDLGLPPPASATRRRSAAVSRTATSTSRRAARARCSSASRGTSPARRRPARRTSAPASCRSDGAGDLLRSRA